MVYIIHILKSKKFMIKLKDLSSLINSDQKHVKLKGKSLKQNCYGSDMVMIGNAAFNIFIIPNKWFPLKNETQLWINKSLKADPHPGFSCYY